MGGTAEQQGRLVEGCRAHWRLEVFREEGQEEYRTFLFESWKDVDKTEAASGSVKKKVECFYFVSRPQNISYYIVSQVLRVLLATIILVHIIHLSRRYFSSHCGAQEKMKRSALYY